MAQLFNVGPVYPKPVVDIINSMLKQLKNRNPSTDSKCYVHTANFIQQIYDGSFLRNTFDESSFNQFNMEGYQEKVLSCKGDWNLVQNIINDSIKHLNMAMDKKYLPFNKKYLEGITFAGFFESKAKNNFNGEINCNFIKFINEPKLSYEYTKDLVLVKLKQDISDSIKEPAEKFCKKNFKLKSDELTFWNIMADWNRWCNNFRKSFPNIYTEFINCCKNGSLFLDFKTWLINDLKFRLGDNYVFEPGNFRLGSFDGSKIDGCFKRYLINGIKSNKFNILRQLPKNITYYYTDDSFKTEKVEKSENKAVYDINDVCIF